MQYVFCCTVHMFFLSIIVIIQIADLNYSFYLFTFFSVFTFTSFTVLANISSPNIPAIYVSQMGLSDYRPTYILHYTIIEI